MPSCIVRAIVGASDARASGSSRPTIAHEHLAEIGHVDRAVGRERADRGEDLAPRAVVERGHEAGRADAVGEGVRVLRATVGELALVERPGTGSWRRTRRASGRSRAAASHRDGGR